MLKITERKAGDITILDLEGNLVMGVCAQLSKTTRDLIDQNRQEVLLNFQKVKFVDSSGLGELIICSRALGEAGGHLRLTSLSEKTREVLALGSVLSLFDVYDDESQALNAFRD